MTPELLLVDDNPAMIQLLARMLVGAGRLRFATSGAAALDQLRAAPTDLVLLDAEMPGLSGFDVCADGSCRWPIHPDEARRDALWLLLSGRS